MDDDDKAELLNDLIGQARRAGADAADAVYAEYRSLSAQQRLGKPEAVERSEGGDLGLRVLVGRRQAVVSSTDLSAPALAELVERCVGMAGQPRRTPGPGSPIPASWPDSWRRSTVWTRSSPRPMTSSAGRRRPRRRRWRSPA